MQANNQNLHEDLHEIPPKVSMARDQSPKPRLNRHLKLQPTPTPKLHMCSKLFQAPFQSKTQNVINFLIGFRFQRQQMRNYKILRKSRLLHLIFISQQGVTFWKALCQYPLNQFQRGSTLLKVSVAHRRLI
jgi:hypothetical protein